MILSIWVFIAVLVVAWEREGWGATAAAAAYLWPVLPSVKPVLVIQDSSYLSPPTRLPAKTPMMTTRTGNHCDER